MTSLTNILHQVNPIELQQGGDAGIFLKHLCKKKRKKKKKKKKNENFGNEYSANEESDYARWIKNRSNNLRILNKGGNVKKNTHTNVL